MRQVRHGSATTTNAIRAEIQRSDASLAALSREPGINPKIVAKWRKRTTADDMKTGPKEPRSTALPDVEGDKPQRRKFNRCSTGFFPIKITGLKAAKGRLYLSSALTATCQVHARPTRRPGRQ